MALIDRPFLSLLCIYLFLGSLVITCIKALETNPETQESDRVINLPGQPSNPSISQFSGYVTVNKEHGRALFYWFFEAQSETSKKPLLLWLNGGPGCSSIGYGAASELGPLRVSKDGAGVYFNEFAWSKEANLLFLESPVGVGFSYTNTSSDLTILDDNFVAEDAYTFLLEWLQRFPQHKSRDLFISGESYAGHYVPQLAELVYDRNKDKTKYPLINLKGFIVGNPETNDYYDYKGLLEYAWSHAVISDQLYDKAKHVCDFRVSNWSNDCNDAMNLVFEKYSEIDIYNIYAPTCLINTTSSSVGSNDSLTKANNYMIRRLRIPGGYDPCYSTYSEEYFNRADVQSSLHAKISGNSRGKWRVCNDLILYKYNFTVFSVLPIYTKLIKGGLKIWIYSGDADGRVPVIGSRYCIEALGLPLTTSWRSWFHNHQGESIVLEGTGRAPKPKFSKGTRVEGFQGSWYSATIVEVMENVKFLVQYHNLVTDDETGSLREEAGASDIRPSRPRIQHAYAFKLSEIVDAWYDDGWWMGCIVKVHNKLKNTVHFKTTEELEFGLCELPHQEWIDRNWFAVPKICSLYLH